MQVYLVGGAVRDQLLGLPVGERDWVVVGATPEELLHLGYRPVGRDFPVFLHPQTHEEYALARRERKVGPGYRGFVTVFAPDVSLEEDLLRRDLTINAMAQASDGTIIDPFGGQQDLGLRVLRHVSAAFVEDPVRLLRVARFAARFQPLGFTVAPDTLNLLRQMVADGETKALNPQRIWRETARAMGEAEPQAFFDQIAASGAMPSVFPEINWNDDARRALQAAARLSTDAAVRFAAACHQSTVADIERLGQRLALAAEFLGLAVLTVRHQQTLARAHELSSEELLALLEAVDAFRREPRFGQLLLAAEACQQHSSPRSPSWELLRRAQAAAAKVRLTAAQAHGLSGPQIAAAMRQERTRILVQLSGTASQSG